MTRDELWARFSAAQGNGWKIKKEDLPESVPEPFFPEPDKVFKALELLSPSEVKFLVLGQDPYADSVMLNGVKVPFATGHAFAINENCPKDKRPASLVRIMNAVYEPGSGRHDLHDWITKRKVLLLNAALTVPQPQDNQNTRDVAGRHLKLWRKFTECIINQLRTQNPSATLIAWGRPAMKILDGVAGASDGGESNAYIWAYHPTASVKGKRSFANFWRHVQVEGRLALRTVSA